MKFKKTDAKINTTKAWFDQKLISDQQWRFKSSLENEISMLVTNSWVSEQCSTYVPFRKQKRISYYIYNSGASQDLMLTTQYNDPFFPIKKKKKRKKERRKKHMAFKWLLRLKTWKFNGL